MEVREASGGQRVSPNTVYVIPPGAELTISGDHLRVARLVRAAGAQYPIDSLFKSLARERGARALGVVLWGMGSDGAQGLQAFKAEGGVALVQQPDSAQYAAMPSNALSATDADFVAPAERLPSLLAAAIASVALPSTPPPRDKAQLKAEALEHILAHLHQHTRHDFSLYKPSTLTRRVERRMAVHGVADMEVYAALLAGNAAELELLFREMLIGVTRFFRDTPAWQELQQLALPELLARSTAEQRPLRAWVAGCSTGEEAYSLAMALVEVAEAQEMGGTLALQIFATDLSADAIAFARTGFYPCEVAEDVGAQRLARFFTRQGGGYVVNQRIREMVLFAQHDVGQDPPFTKLDILCCRNLLIYFGATLQQRLMPLFHYCLRPGGLLLLGGSETVGRFQALFQPVQPKSRLYWRRDNGAGPACIYFPSPRPVPAPSPTMADMSNLIPSPTNLQTTAEQLLLKAFTPAAVLVTAAATSSTSTAALAATWSRRRARPTGTCT